MIFWIIVFLISLAALVKGADWLLKSAEKIGLAIGLPSFIIGVVIVGMGTSFPEIVSSMIAVFKDQTEMVPAGVIGSNIANILLIVGLSSVIGGRLAVTKNLIDLDIPLIAISTVVFLGIVMDQKIVLGESIILLVLFVIYILYSLLHKEDEEDKKTEKLPGRVERRQHEATISKKEIKKRPKVTTKDIIILVIGLTFLLVGSKYFVDAIIELSAIFSISTGVIALAAASVGTSLPELLVSVKAAWNKKAEMALGSIFGSNIFNILLVVGLPGLFKTLHVDDQTFAIGVPVMVVATFLFVISGISRRIHIYEGAMYLVIYLFFMLRLFGVV
ncbi:MAG: calcium/sodium antiporter [Parcubacteria group bacterium]|nr:calcium/sodium antiporter [Parcubacteria group bacterium]